MQAYGVLDRQVYEVDSAGHTIRASAGIGGFPWLAGYLYRCSTQAWGYICKHGMPLESMITSPLLSTVQLGFFAHACAYPDPAAPSELPTCKPAPNWNIPDIYELPAQKCLPCDRQCGSICAPAHAPPDPAAPPELPGDEPGPDLVSRSAGRERRGSTQTGRHLQCPSGA